MPFNMCQPTKDGVTSSTHIVQPVIFDDSIKNTVKVGDAVSISGADTATPTVVKYKDGFFYGFVQEVLKGGYGSVVRATEGCFVPCSDTVAAGDLLCIKTADGTATNSATGSFAVNGFFTGQSQQSWMPDGTKVKAAEVVVGYGRSLRETNPLPQATRKTKEAK